MTPYGLYRLKRGLDAPSKPNPWMLRGNLLEPRARTAYEAHTGNPMVQVVAESVEHPFIRASLDGISATDSLLLEIKCPSRESHQLAVNGIVPDYYVDQVQQQLFVTGFDLAHYWSFDGENGVLVEVQRDQARIDKIVEENIRFWARVQAGVWSGNEWDIAAAAWRIANAECDAAKDREEIARKALLGLLAESEPKREGGGVIVTRVDRKGGIDYDKGLAALGITKDQLEPYRKEGSKTIQVRDAGVAEEIKPDLLRTPTAVVAPNASETLDAPEQGENLILTV
jgi:putative phage-type endonuclease